MVMAIMRIGLLSWDASLALIGTVCLASLQLMVHKTQSLILPSSNGEGGKGGSPTENNSNQASESQFSFFDPLIA
jgi:hypothetical protein